MTNTNTPSATAALVDRYTALYEHDWDVRRFGDRYLLVTDGACTYWIDGEDITAEALDSFDLTGDYTELCQEILGMHDESVPQDVLELARGVFHTQTIAHGF